MKSRRPFQAGGSLFPFGVAYQPKRIAVRWRRRIAAPTRESGHGRHP